tara:strand:+ start:133 stop:282 length:150 start_codon:yes stop_codon:yes gene_type:complete
MVWIINQPSGYWDNLKSVINADHEIKAYLDKLVSEPQIELAEAKKPVKP